MAKTFADIVKELRALVPELRYMPVHLGSPLAAQLGPCFLPCPPEQLPQPRGWLAGLCGLEVPPDTKPGIHLPEQMDWLQEQAAAFIPAIEEVIFVLLRVLFAFAWLVSGLVWDWLGQVQSFCIWQHCRCQTCPVLRRCL